MLIGLGYNLHEIQLIERAGKVDIIKINENKVKLFGVANQLYLSSYCILRIQPDYNYINLQIITSVKINNIKTENNIKK